MSCFETRASTSGINPGISVPRGCLDWSLGLGIRTSYAKMKELASSEFLASVYGFAYSGAGLMPYQIPEVMIVGQGGTPVAESDFKRHDLCSLPAGERK